MKRTQASKKPALSTVNQINWWKDSDDIHVAHGTMFVIHKLSARVFEVRFGWHHQNTMPTDAMYTAPRFQGKLKDCKAHVESTWFENYIIATPCPRGWDRIDNTVDEGELIEAALADALDDHYEVVVGNIGTVYSGPYMAEAATHFIEYVEQSKSGIGRAGHESVTMFKNGEIINEFQGDKELLNDLFDGEDDIVLPPDDEATQHPEDSNPFQRNDAGGRDTPLPLPEVLPFTKAPALPLCECRDSECVCGGTCRQPAPDVLYRTEFENMHMPGVAMCEECTEDAIRSGLYSYVPTDLNDIWDTLDDVEPTDPIQAVWDRFDGPRPYSKDILPGESTLDRIADVIVLFVGLAWSIIGLA